MKVLVNAISVKEGGSLVVLSRLLAGMAQRRPDIEWHAAVDRTVARQEILPRTVTTWTFPWFGRSAVRVIGWYELALPALVRRIGADVLFSQTNYLPRRRVACPTLLLEQHAGHFSPEFKRLMERYAGTRAAVWAWRRKSAWVRASVRSADRVIVQTAALAAAIATQADVPRARIDVVAHGPGLATHVDRPRPWPSGRPWRIGYVSKFGVQKDFATALRAIRSLAQRGRDVTLVLTLDPRVPGVAEVLRDADALGIGARVDNRGELGRDAVAALYDELDVLVFPSLCESFGFPLAEAMARALPVAIARTPGNAEVAGEDALAFAPGDWQGLAEAVATIMDDAGAYAAQSARSLAAAGRLDWDAACAGTLAAIERTAHV